MCNCNILISLQACTIYKFTTYSDDNIYCIGLVSIYEWTIISIVVKFKLNRADQIIVQKFTKNIVTARFK